MDVKISKKSGESFTFEQYGLWVEDFIVSSIPLEAEYGKAEGMDGNVDYGATYGTRTIRVPFIMRANDLHDYPLLRDFIFEKLNDAESFYIQERRRAKKLAYAFVDTNEAPRMQKGTENKFVSGKRYLVRVQNSFDLEQMELDGEGELIFETTELPFAESIGTTADIDKKGIDANSEIWGFGMGLISDDEGLKYTKTGTSFKIWNAGNVPIHPFFQDLKITITGAAGSSFELKNTTTGETFKINDAVKATDKIVIDGPIVLINNVNSFHRTNHEFITLKPGWNSFTVKGATNATIAFDMRFYYL